MGRKEGAKNVSEEVKSKIWDMYCIGVKQKCMAEYYNMPQSTVCNIIRRKKDSNNENPPPKRGPPPILDARGLRSLTSCVRKNKFKSLQQITNEFNVNRVVKVSKTTVRRAIRKCELRNYVAVTKPFLSPKNIKKRMQWARKHSMWDENKWDRVIFSDETSVTVKPTKQRKQVWRKMGTKYNTENLVPSFKSGYIGISVWAAFSSRGRTPLVRIDGTLDRHKYQKILEEELIPFISTNYETDEHIVYQQDSCGPHRAKSISSYLDAKGIEVMKWPPQSPDLNPIENAWSVLKYKLRARPKFPTNATDLFNTLQTEWSNLPDSLFLKLVRSMPTRANLVKLNKGKSTKY